MTYVANAASRTYGGADPALSGTVTGFVNGDTQASATAGTLAFSGTDTASSPVGIYGINGSGLSATNYVFVQAAGNAAALAINPATLTYVANTASRTNGGADPALSGTVTGFVNGDTLVSATTGTLSFSGADTASSPVGSTAINGSGLSATNYVLVQAAGNAAALSINPAILTYVANAASRTFGGADPALSGTVTGFVNRDTQATATSGTLKFTSTDTSSSPVGSYAINGSGLSATNYVLVQAAGNATALTVTPAQSTSTLTTSTTAVLTSFTSSIQAPPRDPNTVQGSAPFIVPPPAVLPPPPPTPAPPPLVVSPLTELSDTPNSSDQATDEVAGSLDGDNSPSGERRAGGGRRNEVLIAGMLANARVPPPPPPTDVSALSSFGNSSLWQ